jgi:MoaA/NifB/PqqE/SkfB family radical SAM enzyme
VSAKPWVELWLEVEPACNLHCAFCYNPWRDGLAPTPVRRTAAEILDCLRPLLSDVDCRQIAISGGEPLLRPDLFDIVEPLAAYGIPLVLTTNGVLLTREKISLLKRASITSVQIPLHSHREELHDRLSGGVCWRAALRAFVWLREAGMPVTPVFVATNLNLDDFSAVIRICGSLGLSRIIFNRFIPSGLGRLNQSALGVPDDAAILRVIDEAHADAVRSGVTIQLGVPVRVPVALEGVWTQVELASCPVGAGQQRWTVGPDLELRRCNQSLASVGNLRDEGAVRLMDELRSTIGRSDRPREIHTCQILEHRELVQISV